ncbi:hypothetical protein [Saccharopolyspora shandongensis]|uniref:hypothetical protein n=1 Tax=Saccharopolyspora shandongensis TaxID=418495 RepID=UPI0033E153F3
MSPSGSREDAHPWEQRNGVAYLAEAEAAADAELKSSAADTGVMPAIQESALKNPVADAGTGRVEAVEAATATATKTETRKAAKSAFAAKKVSTEDDTPSKPTHRVSKPVVAAAAVAGLVLLSVPVLIASLSNNNSPSRALPPNPAAFSNDGQAQAGFVPGMAQEQGQAMPPAGLPVGAPPPVNSGGLSNAPMGAGAPPIDRVPPVPGTPNNPVPATNAIPASFVTFAGPGCGAGSFSRPGYYTDGSKGWTSANGAYAADGCNGQFFSLPMSGDQNKDADNAAVWRFNTGDIKQGSCQVSVFVPSGGVEQVGGNPSYYTVYNTDRTDTPEGDFRINQAGHQNSWVDGGKFPVNNGLLTIMLHDRGVDWSSGHTGAHHAAAQVKLQCSAA